MFLPLLKASQLKYDTSMTYLCVQGVVVDILVVNLGICKY